MNVPNKEYLILPIVVLWVIFWLPDLFNLSMDAWYGFPYVLTSGLVLIGATWVTIVKVVDGYK